MQVARIARAEYLRWKVAEFVDAARAIGASELQIVARHIFPQVTPSPRLAIYPGVMILLTVLSYNFLGDGLRDALDPSLRSV